MGDFLQSAAGLGAELERMGAGDESFDRTVYRLLSQLLEHNPRFSWIGVYEARFDGSLHLGPFAGKPTDHVFVPAGRGICGQVMRAQQTLYVPDVRGFDGYLAGIAETRSELVVPVMNPEQVFGVLDLQSTEVDAFEGPVRAQLEEVAQWLADRFESRDLEPLDRCPRLLSA